MEKTAYATEVNCHLTDRTFTQYQPSRAGPQNMPEQGRMTSEEWRQTVIHGASTIMQINDVKNYVAGNCPKCACQPNEIKHLFQMRK